MTSVNAIRRGLYDRFIDEWVIGGEPRTPFCFDNEDFTPPSDAEGEVSPWARLSVRHLDAGQDSLGSPGNRKFTRIASARLELYSRPGRGTSEEDALVEAGIALFEGRRVPETSGWFLDAIPREIGLVEEGRWRLSTIEARFEYEQIK